MSHAVHRSCLKIVVNRSYLHGSVGPFQSLLGITELKRTLSDSQLKIFIGTWNMNGKVCRFFMAGNSKFKFKFKFLFDVFSVNLAILQPNWLRNVTVGLSFCVVDALVFKSNDFSTRFQLFDKDVRLNLIFAYSKSNFFSCHESHETSRRVLSALLSHSLVSTNKDDNAHITAFENLTRLIIHKRGIFKRDYALRHEVSILPCNEL